MPSPYVKSLAKKLDKPESEIEKAWKKAKEITADKFNKKVTDLESKDFDYVTGVVKNILGVKESSYNIKPKTFLESNLSIEEFIETMVSGSFNIPNVTLNKKVDPEPFEPEEDLDNTKSEIVKNMSNEIEDSLDPLGESITKSYPSYSTEDITRAIDERPLK